MAKKKITRGRPKGSTSPEGYVPSHLRRQHMNIRLPAWMAEKLFEEEENISRYIEALVVNDKKWKEPKL